MVVNSPQRLPEDVSLRSIIFETRINGKEEGPLYEFADALRDDKRVLHVMEDEDREGISIRLNGGRVDAYESGDIHVTGTDFDNIETAVETLSDIAYEYTGGTLSEPSFSNAIAVVDREQNIDVDSLTPERVEAADVTSEGLDFIVEVTLAEFPEATIKIFPNGQVVIENISSVEGVEGLVEWAQSTSFPRP